MPKPVAAGAAGRVCCRRVPHVLAAGAAGRRGCCRSPRDRNRCVRCRTSPRVPQGSAGSRQARQLPQVAAGAARRVCCRRAPQVLAAGAAVAPGRGWTQTRPAASTRFPFGALRSPSGITGKANLMRKARLSRMTFAQTMHWRRKKERIILAQKLRPGWRGAFGAAPYKVTEHRGVARCDPPQQVYGRPRHFLKGLGPGDANVP